MVVGETSAGNAVAVRELRNQYDSQIKFTRSAARSEANVASLLQSEGAGGSGATTGGTTTASRGNLLNLLV